MAKDILGHYQFGCNQAPVKVEKICQIIRRVYGFNPSILYVKTGKPQLLGMLQRSENKSARIIIEVTGLTWCWKRFIACKEIAHLLIDSESSGYTKDLEGLVRDFVSLDKAPNHSDEMASEIVASVVAAEILLPWDCRHAIDAMLDAGKTNLDIATLYRVPEKVVEQRLSKSMRAIMAEWYA